MLCKNMDGAIVSVDARQEFPGVSFPEDCSVYAWEYPYFWVHETPAPETGMYARAVQDLHLQDADGKYWQAWAVQDFAQEEIKSILVQAVQRNLDCTAQELGYDGILSMCSYWSSGDPKFRAEGQAGVAWRDSCWSKCYEVMQKCLAGEISIPTPEELIQMLCKLELQE